MSSFLAYERFSLIYDQLMTDAPYSEWLQFLERHVAEYNLMNKKILDLGCGTGRLTSMVAQNGYSVIGVDSSSEMLAIARERLQSQNMTTLPLLQQDIRELDLNESFGVIYSFCDTINYLLEDDDVQITFAHVARHLEKGGLFLFDVHSPFKITDHFASGPIVDEDESIAYIWVPDVDPLTLRVDHHLHFFVQQENGLYRRYSEIHQQRGYTLKQLEGWLRAVHLEVLSLTADFTTGSPNDRSERLFFVAQKIK